MILDESLQTGTGPTMVLILQLRNRKNHLTISYEGEEFTRQISSSHRTKKIYRTACKAIKCLLPLVQQKAWTTNGTCIQYVQTSQNKVFQTPEIFNFLLSNYDIKVEAKE